MREVREDEQVKVERRQRGRRESMANPEPSKESERSRQRPREKRVFITEIKVGKSFKSNVKMSFVSIQSVLCGEDVLISVNPGKTLGNSNPSVAVPGLPGNLEGRVRVEMRALRRAGLEQPNL